MLVSNDLQRQRRLVEVEEKIANNTSEDCLDTEYVDLVTESAFLSRALEHSPSIIRGKFVRAENICKQYGTKQQLFNVIWQRGWTEFFWLENPDGSYNYYLKLKSMIDEDINVNRLESIVSLYSALSCASSLSLFKQKINLKEEENFFKNLYRTLEKDNDRHSSFLYLRICFLEKRIIQFINDKETLNGLLVKLADALDQAASYVDISLETQFAELDMISLVVPDNEMFDYIIDHLSDLLLLRDHEISAAQLEMKRGSQLLLGGYLGKTIEHIGKCVYLFGKEPTKTEYITACCTLGDAYMGLDLLYSSKVMFTKAVAMILYNIQTSQSPNRLLIVILTKLCYLSLRSGQIVNFLMAFESWTIFEKYSPSYQDHDFLTEMGRDGRRLAARFLSCSVEDKSYSKLPAILQRLGMIVPVDVLFYKLGYPECFTDYFRKNMQDHPDWEVKMRKFIYDPLFLYANSISDHKTRLESLICGCRFIATFDSDRILQVYSELLLAFMESVISTTKCDDIIISTSQIHIEVIKTNHGETEICKGLSREDYIFKVNYLTINGKEAWKAFVSFLSLFLIQNVRSISMEQLFADQHKKEKLLNRLYVMMTYEDDIYALYNEDYKNTIEMWVAPEDKCYPFKGKKELSNPFKKKRGVQAKGIK